MRHFLPLVIMRASDDIVFYYIAEQIKAFKEGLSKFEEDQSDLEKDLLTLDEETLKQVQALKQQMRELKQETQALKHQWKVIELGTPLILAVSCMLSGGREDMFDTFHARGYLGVMLASECFSYNELLQEAANGGNPSLLGKIFSIYFDSNSKNTLADIMAQDDLVVAGIKGGSLDCLTKILDELDKKSYGFSKEQLLTYLSKAIDSNNHHIVKKIIELIPAVQLQSVHIPLAVMEQTILPVLSLRQRMNRHSCSRVVDFQNYQFLVLLKSAMINPVGVFLNRLVVEQKNENPS